MGRIRRHWKGLTATAIALALVLAVGVPWVYIHLVEGKQPKPLSLNNVPAAATTSASTPSATSSAASSSSATSSSTVTGVWTVVAGSTAGYRVHETLAGQSATAVGRTTAVSGSLTISGTEVSSATFTVQLASVTSDRSQRDGQFAGRIMDTAQYPTGTFVLTKPIQLSTIAPIGKTITATATGNLTLHGTTKQVTFPVHAKRTASSIAVTGDITVNYGDYHIPNPSFGGFVSVGKSGTIEFLLITARR